MEMKLSSVDAETGGFSHYISTPRRLAHDKLNPEAPSHLFCFRPPKHHLKYLRPKHQSPTKDQISEPNVQTMQIKIVLTVLAAGSTAVYAMKLPSAFPGGESNHPKVQPTRWA